METLNLTLGTCRGHLARNRLPPLRRPGARTTLGPACSSVSYRPARQNR
jgi:hypothetical protein